MKIFSIDDQLRCMMSANLLKYIYHHSVLVIGLITAHTICRKSMFSSVEYLTVAIVICPEVTVSVIPASIQSNKTVKFIFWSRQTKMGSSWWQVYLHSPNQNGRCCAMWLKIARWTARNFKIFVYPSGKLVPRRWKRYMVVFFWICVVLYLSTPAFEYNFEMPCIYEGILTLRKVIFTLYSQI